MGNDDGVSPGPPNARSSRRNTFSPSIVAMNGALPALNRLLAAKGVDRTGERIINDALKRGIKVEYVDRKELDRISRTGAHQGFIALVERFRYAEGPEAIVETARRKGEDPLVVVLDKICDPRNLGAIIRTANMAGAHGVIIAKNRAVGLTATVAKASAGAIFNSLITASK